MSSTNGLPPRATPAAPRVVRARGLRREMTAPERVLWLALRDRRFSTLKFRRQVPIGPYFVDFFDAAHQLVIELDGDSHIGRAEYDRDRQDWLEGQGLHVLRFGNDDVLKDLDAVLASILRTVSALEPSRLQRPRMRRSFSPSPFEREGHRRPDEESSGVGLHSGLGEANNLNPDGLGSRHPSSGPPGHLLPQGEKGMRTSAIGGGATLSGGSESDGFRSGHPSSGPPGHLLPQGEKGWDSLDRVGRNGGPG